MELSSSNIVKSKPKPICLKRESGEQEGKGGDKITTHKGDNNQLNDLDLGRDNMNRQTADGTLNLAT